MENKKQAIEANFEKYKGKEIFKTVRIAGDDYSAFVFPSPIKVNDVSETKIDDEFTKVTIDGVEYQAITCAFYGYIAQKEISVSFHGIDKHNDINMDAEFPYDLLGGNDQFNYVFAIPQEYIDLLKKVYKADEEWGLFVSCEYSNRIDKDRSMSKRLFL